MPDNSNDSTKSKVIINLCDCEQVLGTIGNGVAQLVYTDPPFATGKMQLRGNLGFDDNRPEYMNFMKHVLVECIRVLNSTGSLMVHLDWRMIHYVKVMLDELLGEDHFMNEIIWAFDYGGRSKKYWPRKHQTILWYVKDKKNYTFNRDEVDRIPYMAPGLAGKEKEARGKTPTDVWWHTIVHTTGAEKTGYPTQKPLGIVERIVKVHSNPGDLIIDPFAGSGTTGEAAIKNNRSCLLIDNNVDAIHTMCKRLGINKVQVP